MTSPGSTRRLMKPGAKAPAAASFARSGGCTGPFSELKTKKKGTARLKGRLTGCANPLKFIGNHWLIARFASARVPNISAKPAAVRELRRESPPKMAVFRPFGDSSQKRQRQGGGDVHFPASLRSYRA